MVLTIYTVIKDKFVDIIGKGWGVGGGVKWVFFVL